jgi:hypothetical protein
MGRWSGSWMGSGGSWWGWGIRRGWCSVLIRTSVHRWSSANPCASGPRRSSASSRASCCGDNLSADTGPFDFSAAVPPSAQARRHRRTDPGVTRRSRAISPVLSPAANSPAA